MHGYLKIEPSWCSFLFFSFQLKTKSSWQVLMFSYIHHIVYIPYIAYYLRWKTFAVPCLYLYARKNVHNYHLLQAFIVFTCKNLPKSFHGCESIGKRTCEFFTMNNKQYMILTLLHSYWYKKLKNNNYCYWVVSHIWTFNITNGTIYWLDPKTAHAIEPF